ncbi:MAG: hypothetical protein H8D56_10150 [Planctomycetes bacterium]|nr:hypothetical protein [Planctomycetota bacterium]MBL7143620.1 hypothetical protein [Phycisphaerae bacterium]
MTKGFEDFNNDLCDKLFDFIYPDESNLSDKEVDAEIQRLGIDVRPAWDKIQMALHHHKETENARTKLKYATKKRRSILAKLKNVQSPYLPRNREEILKFIQKRFMQPEQAIYCRKLETAASDEDLKSILEDILRLDELSKDSDDVKT